MPKIHFHRAAAAVLLAAGVLMGCDGAQQREPLPSYESTTLGVAQSISGVAAAEPETAASAASAGVKR